MPCDLVNIVDGISVIKAVWECYDSLEREDWVKPCQMIQFVYHTLVSDYASY